MKFTGVYATCALAALQLLAAPPCVTGHQVSVYGSFDDDKCTKVSTVKITEGGCNDTDSSKCTAYGEYYGMNHCGDDRDSVLNATFGDSPYFMIEYYEDSHCNTLASSEVYLADGDCHFFTTGSVRVWTAKDKSLAAVLQAGRCDSDEWWIYDKLNVSVNTGACIPQEEYDTLAVKYILRGDPPASSSILPAAPPANNKVTISVGNDDANCTKPSTVTIEEGGCDGTESPEYCEGYGVGMSSSNMTYYGQSFCSDSRESYLQATFGNATLFIVEYFDDNSCTHMYASDVYLADGEVHYFTLGAMKVWVADDKSQVAILTSADTSDSTNWDVMDGMNVSVSAGDCIIESIYRMNSMRYVLTGNLSSSSSSSSGGETNTSATSPSSAPVRSLTRFLAVLVVLVATSFAL